MHAVVVESLEEYLAGALEASRRRDIEAHLDICEACRDEVAGMMELSDLFGSLKTDLAPEPPANFYAAVMRQVGERKPAPSFSDMFGWNFAFGRRLVFASLITLAVLGSYLVSRESGNFGAYGPEVVMADEYSPAFESAPAQDKMLITLAAYGQ